MHRLTKACLKRPVAVIVILIGLILFGITSITRFELKLMPDMNIPMMVVMETYPGASPEEVDDLVIEEIREACSSISGLSKTVTQSNENVGYVILQFEYGTDMDQAYDDVKQVVDVVAYSLPEDAGDPVIMEIDMNAIADMTLSISADSDDIDIKKEVNEVVEPEFKKAGALADISTTGGDERYISVRLIPEYAAQYGISTSSVVAAIQAVNYSMPAGSVNYGDLYLNMETEVAYETIPQLEQVPITTARGQTIHLGDVANISYAVSDTTSLSRYNGTDNISMSLTRRQSSSSVTLSRQIKGYIEALKEKAPELTIQVVYDSADEIIDTLKSVFLTLIEGIALSMFVIFLFFGDLKGSLIVGSTMPISLLAALILMRFMGFSLNVITLTAMVLSIGMITDNAVVVIELCFRKKKEGYEYPDAAYLGTRTVINSVIGSTLTTVVVYLPLALLKGISGQLFQQLGYTIVFVLMASLVSAITIVPFFYMLYQPRERENNPFSRALAAFAGKYAKFLAGVLKRKKLATLIALIAFGITIWMATFLDSELLAATDEGIIAVNVSFRPNLNLDVMDEEMRKIEDYVVSTGVVDSYSMSVSRTSSSGSINAYKSEDVKDSSQAIADVWNRDLKGFSPVCDISVRSGSTIGMDSLVTGSVYEVDISSGSREQLLEASDMILQAMEETPGVISASSTVTETGSKAKVVIDPVMAAAKGFSAQQISGMIYANMTGTNATDVTIDGVKYQITVEYPKDQFRTIADIRSMTFTNMQGVSVPITDIADITFVSAPQTISRQDGRFNATVTATMTEETRADIVEVLKPKVESLPLGDDIRFETSATSEAMQEEFSGLGEAIIIALYLVFMVMAIQFGSIVYALLIMLCIPFAGIGSILLMLIMRVKVSITSLMGVLMLAGIVVNNGIIFIDTANQFRDEGEEIAEALVHAGRDRMRPIFMTTLTTELAMLPTAFKLAKDSEVMQGMAVVIVGGLFASTILTLILLPTFYMIVDKLRRNKPKKAAIYAREPEAPLFAEGEKEEYAVPEMAAQPAEGPCPGPEDDPAEEPAEFLPEEDAAEETGIGPAEIPEEVAADDSEEKPESGIEIEDID